MIYHRKFGFCSKALAFCKMSSFVTFRLLDLLFFLKRGKNPLQRPQINLFVSVFRQFIFDTSSGRSCCFQPFVALPIASGRQKVVGKLSSRIDGAPGDVAFIGTSTSLFQS